MESNGLNVFDTPAAPQHTCTAIADRATSRSCNCIETGPGWHALPGRGSWHCLFQNVAFAAYFPLCTFFAELLAVNKHLTNIWNWNSGSFASAFVLVHIVFAALVSLTKRLSM